MTTESTATPSETPLLSEARGETDVPLLEETIGDNFEPHRRGVRRPRGAGRVRQRPALDLGRARPRRRRARPRPDRRRHRARATGSASGRRTAPSGRSRSTPPRRSARSWSTSTRPTAPTSSPTPSTSPGMRLLVSASEFKTSDYRAMVEETARRVPRASSGWSTSTPTTGTTLVAEGDGGRRPTPWPSGWPTPATGRPDQHPVHVRHHRLPQGRHAQPPQHPQQRLLHHRADQLHRRGPALHPGALLPLLRDGDGQPRLHHPRRHDGDPGARLRPRDHAARDRRGALHRRVRRADDVHRDAEPPDLRRPRPRRRCAPGSWPARSARSR